MRYKCPNCARFAVPETHQRECVALDPDAQYKECPRCQVSKGVGEFFSDKSKTDGLSTYCKLCHNKRTGDYQKRHRRKWSIRRYGMTVEEYERRLEEQDGVCAICKSFCTVRGDVLSVDHDHTTGEVRGLLCSNCNFMLGYAQDDPATLLEAVEYLEVT